MSPYPPFAGEVEVALPPNRLENVRAVCFAARSTLVACVDGQIVGLAPTGRRLWRVAMTGLTVHSAILHPDLNFLVAGGVPAVSNPASFLAGPSHPSNQKHPVLHVWEIQVSRGAELRHLENFAGAVFALAYSPNAQQVACAGALGSVVVMQQLPVGRLRTVRRLDMPAKCLSVAWATDARLIAAGDDGILTLWDVAAGSVLTNVEHPGRRLKDIVLGHNLLLLVSSGEAAVSAYPFASPEAEEEAPKAAQDWKKEREADAAGRAQAFTKRLQREKRERQKRLKARIKADEQRMLRDAESRLNRLPPVAPKKARKPGPFSQP
jgi:hypothetical protein